MALFFKAGVLWGNIGGNGLPKMRPLKNVVFCSRLRKTKNLTTGIY